MKLRYEGWDLDIKTDVQGCMAIKAIHTDGSPSFKVPIGDPRLTYLGEVTLLTTQRIEDS